MEIFATNDYPESLIVTEKDLKAGGGWSEKMPSSITGGGGHAHALVKIYQFF